MWLSYTISFDHTSKHWKSKNHSLKCDKSQEIQRTHLKLKSSPVVSIQCYKKSGWNLLKYYEWKQTTNVRTKKISGNTTAVVTITNHRAGDGRPEMPKFSSTDPPQRFISSRGRFLKLIWNQTKTMQPDLSDGSFTPKIFTPQTALFGESN